MKTQRQSDVILRLLDAAQEVEDSVTHHGLAGEDELADKIRPSIPRRPRRPIELEAAPEPGVPEPPGSDPMPGAETG